MLARFLPQSRQLDRLLGGAIMRAARGDPT
jgi:hypothetical protein